MRNTQSSRIATVVRTFLVVTCASLIAVIGVPIAAVASTPQSHAVTFVENDNPSDPVYASQVESAATALTLFVDLNPSFVDSGFSFVNWNTAPDGSGSTFANGSTFSFSSTEVLYAIWTRLFHAVTFVENDSGTDPVDATQIENSSTPLTMFSNLNPVFLNSGFTFVDWNSEANGGGNAYANGSTYSFTGTAVLYAIWSPIPTVTETFATNGGTGSVGSESSQTGQPTTLPTGTELSDPGYTFVGWNTAADGSGTEYAAGATYVFSSNQILYAQWSPDTFTVTYSFDGGVATLSASNYVVGTAALALPNPTFPGNIFDGWFSTETGGNLIGIGGASYVPSGSVQLYAQWTAISTEVLAFSANGGTGTIPPYSGLLGSSTILPTGGGMAMLGYAFAGWNTAADGSGTQYAEGANFVLVNNQTLYAQWSPGPSYTLTFNANGGSGSLDPISGAPGSTITLPDQTGLILAGFELKDWNTNASGSGTSYSAGQALKLSESTVLYAQWSGHKIATLFGAIGTFKGNTSSLNTALKSQIDRVALTIRTRKYLKVDLYGYTASTGLKSLNVALSRARAANVANFLRHRLDVLKVHGVSIASAGEGAIAGQSSSAYSRVEVFGV
jgi:uncharacterized repeat protein (TIGR02543 family)